MNFDLSQFGTLTSLGIFNDVLNYVLVHAGDASSTVTQEEVDEEEEREEEPVSKSQASGVRRRRTVRITRSYTNEVVFIHCFQFLRAMAVKNVEVQKR